MKSEDEKHEDFLQAVSKAVRERRAELGLSQEELSQKAQLHRTYISDIEAGRRNISLKSLQRLAFGLGIAASELMQSAEQKLDGAQCLGGCQVSSFQLMPRGLS